MNRNPLKTVVDSSSVAVEENMFLVNNCSTSSLPVFCMYGYSCPQAGGRYTSSPKSRSKSGPSGKRTWI